MSRLNQVKAVHQNTTKSRKVDMQELLRVLENEYKLYQEILQLLRREREILVSGEGNVKLLSILEELEGFVSEIQELETRRRTIVKVLSTSYSIPVLDMSLARLCEVAETPYAKQFSNVRVKMSEIMEMVKDLNTCIFYLSEKSLEFSTKYLEIFGRSGLTYRSNGSLPRNEEALISRRA